MLLQSLCVMHVHLWNVYMYVYFVSVQSVVLVCVQWVHNEVLARPVSLPYKCWTVSIHRGFVWLPANLTCDTSARDFLRDFDYSPFRHVCKCKGIFLQPQTISSECGQSVYKAPVRWLPATASGVQRKFWVISCPGTKSNQLLLQQWRLVASSQYLPIWGCVLCW